MLVRKLPHSGEQSALEGVRAQRGVVLPLTGACGYSVGCDWRGNRLLRDRAWLRKRARTIRSPNRRLSARAGKAGLDGAGDYESAVVGAASHPNDGIKQRHTGADLACETQQRLDGARVR